GRSRPQVGRRGPRPPGGAQQAARQDHRHGHARSARRRARQSHVASREGSPRAGDEVMFRWLPLVWANLKRRKLRFAFTFISILLAFLMFGMLDALRTSLSQAINLAGADRLMLMSKVNITVSLPRAHYEKVRATPGVRAVA